MNNGVGNTMGKYQVHEGGQRQATKFGPNVRMLGYVSVI
jgi:hypothetical protein